MVVTVSPGQRPARGMRRVSCSQRRPGARTLRVCGEADSKKLGKCLSKWDEDTEVAEPTENFTGNAEGHCPRDTVPAGLCCGSAPGPWGPKSSCTRWVRDTPTSCQSVETMTLKEGIWAS